MPLANTCLAKPVQPDRLRFWERPSFDARPFMDFKTLQTFTRPLDYALAEDEELHPPPRVSVRCRGADVMGFLKALDDGDRLALVPTSQVRLAYRNGVFSIPKDQEKDRMVLDARPPNCLETNDDPWLGSLGSLAQFQHYFLKPNEKAYIFAEDLREYYHSFIITEQRVKRNALKLSVQPWQVRHLKAYQPWMKNYLLTPCLNTMAMGDLRAVSYGQVAHLSVLLSTGSLQLSDFIGLTLPPPRGSLLAGLMIDDFLLVEKHTTDSGPSKAAQVSQQVVDKYAEVGLPRHSGKAVVDAEKASFWGATMDGQLGTMTPNHERVAPLLFLTLETVRIGKVSVALLEMIAGSFVAVFSLRRRFMAALEEIYVEQRGRARTDVVVISPALRDELLTIIPLAVLTKMDLRLSPSDRLIASDASNSCEAGTFCLVGSAVTEEFQTFGIQKGLWNKLLSPYKAYLRERNELAEEEELPDGVLDMHPLWEEVVSSQQFHVQEAPIKRRGRSHINVGEVRAALRAELCEGRRLPSSYMVQLLDSQVAIAALVKGRSSSRALNREIKESIPWHVTCNTRVFYGFVRSALNPADDPTRAVELRTPTRTEASWLTTLKNGDPSLMDEFLAERGSGRLQLAGLPPAESLLPLATMDVRRGHVKRADSRRSARNKTRVEVGSQSSPEVSSAVAAEKYPGHKEEENSGGVKPVGGVVSSSESLPANGALVTEDEIAEAGGAEVETTEAAEYGGLSSQALALLRTMPAAQFLYSKKFGSLEEAFKSGPGILDLFSGSRGLARAMVETADTWVLTFDLAHRPSEDLLKLPLQKLILRMVCSSCFRAMAAGPVCASFSTAITPPVRSKDFPGGVPWCSELQQRKNADGNAMLKFVLAVVVCCQKHQVHFLVENPDGSWLWRQQGSLSCDVVYAGGPCADFRTDFCRYGTPWRKRTKFRTSLSIGGQTVLCNCGKKHVVLRGRSRLHQCNYTKLAEPYPRSLCRILALAMAKDVGLVSSRPLDVAACAKLGTLRAGEALNPGPRRPFVRQRAVNLGDVLLLEPATIALRSKLWDEFSRWFASQFGASNLDLWAGLAPGLFAASLAAYGHHCFDAGKSLHYYRQLLAHIQKTHGSVKPHLSCAWEVVNKWELVEPVTHRVPIPEPLLQAAISLALLWGWRRWAAVTMFNFYAIARIGEVLRANRGDALTPRDILFEQMVVFLKVRAPKSKNRGPRTQYSAVELERCVEFVSSVWNELMPDEMLYPGSASSYRTRWDKILKRLGVPASLKLTPGSLRAGGCIAAYRRKEPIQDILWRMRLAHQKTLSYYLQEVNASSVLPSLSE